MEQLAEVLVLSQQDPALPDRKLQHDLVRGSWGNLRDRRHVVTGNAEGPDDDEVTTLIRQEPHRSTLGVLAAAPSGGLQNHRLLVRHRIRRIADRRLDVLAGEARVGVQQISLSGPFAQLAQDELDRDAGPRMTGFPSITLGFISIRSVTVMPDSFAGFALADLARPPRRRF
jgi:hypothetical protein